MKEEVMPVFYCDVPVHFLVEVATYLRYVGAARARDLADAIMKFTQDGARRMCPAVTGHSHVR